MAVLISSSLGNAFLRAHGFSQSDRRHDLPRLTIPALRDVDIHPRFLNGMIVASRSQSFDRADAHSLDVADPFHATSNGKVLYAVSVYPARDVNRARSAKSHSTAEFGSGESAIFADNPQHSGVSGLAFKRARLAVENEFDFGHSTSRLFPLGRRLSSVRPRLERIPERHGSRGPTDLGAHFSQTLK